MNSVHKLWLFVWLLTRKLEFRLNRPSFEKLVQNVLKGPDLSNISEYYSRSPSSGFWILDYGEQFVGLIALDAYQETLTIASSPVSQKKAPNQKERLKSDGTTSTAIIRHFYVDEAYRSSGIQSDLLAHAIQIAFGSNPSLQRIKAPDSSLITYIRSCLREAGFQLDCVTGRVGVYGWKLGRRTLEREDWKNRIKIE